MLPLDLVKTTFPVWTLRNKKNVSVLLELSGGDSVQFTPNSVRKIDASKVHQLPPFTKFDFVTPSMNALIEAGVVVRPVVPEPTATVAANTKEK